MRTESFTDIGGLYDLLVGLSDEAHSAVVRGEQVDENHQLKQRTSNLQKDGSLPTLREVPRRWFMIDIDDYPTEKPAAEAVAEVVEGLPCSGADYVYQLSSSYRPGTGFLKVHIWFINDVPLVCGQLKAAFRGKCDLAVFSAAQVLYTANPIYEGEADPVDERVHLVRGSGFASVKPIELRKVVKIKTRPQMVDAGDADEVELIDAERGNIGKTFMRDLCRRNYHQLRHRELVRLGSALHNVGFDEDTAAAIVSAVKDPDSGHDFAQCWATYGVGDHQCGFPTIYQLGNKSLLESGYDAI
ncbi:hypothetical protein FM038_013155 [Shewanella eurypsychrophilus]|uniref:Replication protein n=1 Tax=Shewanella eurypsychrophilus TaxID=2593656 RepID=A0ABX6V8X3_9GAMM|nr:MULTISPECIES: hypothetical protein [Shewanella]QFU23003.1 hypothetical protein FS418_14740 [Shewanella sp. YLB-09]QPG58289.1 hypothetical protein FM038_013155 [Shewanella eurypsychrophilus]